MKTKEHPVGFPVAHDTNQNLIKAFDAIKGVPYFCPFCGCELRRKTSSLGTDFFFRKSEAEHTHPICKSIEKTREYHTFSASDSPSSLIATFCRAPLPRLPKVPVSLVDEFEQEENPTSQETPPKPSQELPQVSSLVPFKTLAQVYEYGKFQSDPFAKCGEYCISDYYIHYKWASLFFTDPNFELGARIVHTKFFSYDSDVRTIRFFTFNSKGLRVFFDIYFKNKKAFYSILKKVGVLDKEEQTQRTIRKNMDVLIASTDWTCLGNHTYYTIFTNPKQFYTFFEEN